MNINSHPLSGKTVRIKSSVPGIGGEEYNVEDYWHIASGNSWMNSGVIAARNYAIRAGKTGLPVDDEVLYGKIGLYGHLVHISEIEN